MEKPNRKPLTIFAPAKVNLFLHLTGKRKDGYHLLDSLVAFADVGDEICIKPAENFELMVQGPLASAFPQITNIASPKDPNLVARAAYEMALLFQRDLNIHVTLTKNLPIGAGLGGGSSDAAAMIWGLLEYWQIGPRPPEVITMARKLGADVPACLTCASTRMQGTGEVLNPLLNFPETPVVLVYPGRQSQTANVFKRYRGGFKEDLMMPDRFDHVRSLADFLKNTTNDLHKASSEGVPEIDNAINALRLREGCLLSRMSGSGSACFGLFEDESLAETAAAEIFESNPDWWVRAGWLGRPERY